MVHGVLWDVHIGLHGMEGELCVFVEYSENIDPLIEWCTARELCADGSVWDWIIGWIWAPCYYCMFGDRIGIA